MTPREMLIEQHLKKAADSDRLGRLLDTPAIGYGALGAGIGTGASLLRTALRPREERRGALRRALLTGMGGAGVGAAAAGGLQLMGRSPMSVRDMPAMVSGAAPTRRRRTPAGEVGRALGTGAAGTAAIGGLSALQHAHLMREARNTGLGSPEELLDLVSGKDGIGKIRNKKGKMLKLKKLTPIQSTTVDALEEVANKAHTHGPRAAMRRAESLARDIDTGAVGVDRSPAAHIRHAVRNVGRKRGLDSVATSRFARLARNPRALLGIGGGLALGNYMFRNMWNRD